MQENTIKNPLFKKLVVGSVLFYILSFIASILNYAYYPVVARLVSDVAYGEVQFLVSIFTQLSVGFVALNLLAIIIASRYKNDKKTAMIRSLNVVALTTMIVLVGVGTTALLFTKDLFQFSSVLPFFALAFSLLVNVPFTIALGKLQGEGRFAAAGLLGVSGAGFKLLTSIIFILLGFGTTGAILGLGVGMVITLLIVAIGKQTLRLGKVALSRGGAGTFKYHFAKLQQERRYAYGAAIAVTILTVLSTIDVIVSKAILVPVEAGQYAAIATVSKTILFAAAPIMWLALPHALKGRSGDREVGRFVALTGAIAVILVLLFSAVPSFIVATLLDINPGAYLKLLPAAAVAMGLYSLAFILLTVAVCRSQLRYVTIACLLAVVSFIMTSLLWPSDSAIVRVLAGQIISATGIIIVTISVKRRT